MLRGVLVLHDIRDTEAFCAGVIQRSTLQVPDSELEDCLAYLIGEAWIASQRFDPARHASFQKWCGFTLHCRLIDWHRHRNGQQYRNGHRRPREISWEQDYGGGDKLNNPHTRNNLDPAERSDADLVRLLRSRAGTPPPGHPAHNPRMARTAEG